MLAYRFTLPPDIHEHESETDEMTDEEREEHRAKIEVLKKKYPPPPEPPREQFDPAAFRRDFRAWVRLFLREETTLADLSAAIGSVVKEVATGPAGGGGKDYDLAPRDRLFSRARIRTDIDEIGLGLPVGRSPSRITLHLHPRSDVRLDWLPRELIYSGRESSGSLPNRIHGAGYYYYDETLPCMAFVTAWLTTRLSKPHARIKEIVINRRLNSFFDRRNVPLPWK